MREYQLYKVETNYTLEAEAINFQDTEDTTTSTTDESLGIDYWMLLGIYTLELLFGIIFSLYRMAYHAHASDTSFG